MTGDTPSDETRVRQRADAHGRVEAPGDQIDKGVGKVRFDPDLGIAGQECRQDRGNPHPRETRRQGQTQGATRTAEGF